MPTKVVPDNLITLRGISKRYKKKLALDGINLNVKRRQALAILGANGAGKTTLIEIICRVCKATSGQVNYFFDNRKELGQNIGVQFQTGTWPAGIRGVDVLRFYRGLYANVSPQRIRELMQVFEVEQFMRQNLSTLSGGQQQRFNALLAVIHAPDLIIFDELTTGLDLELQFKILNYIKTLKTGHDHTLIFVSHAPEEIDLLADRLIILKEGRLFSDYLLSEVRTQFKSTRNLLTLFFANQLPSNITEHE